MHGARTSSPSRRGLRPVGNEAWDRQVHTDRPAVAETFSCRGGRRASVQRHAAAGQGADTRGAGKGPDRGRDVPAAAASLPLDAVGPGGENGDGPLHDTQHPQAARTGTDWNQDIQGVAGSRLREEDTRYTGTVRQSPRTCRRAVGGRKAADPGAVAHTEATAAGAGHPRTRTHACRRNGTACLMAAPGVATGKVVGRMTQRHRSRESSLFRPMWRRASTRRWTFMSSPATSPPRVGRGPRVAGKASPMDLPPHADLRLPDERGGGHFLQTDAAASTERRLRIDRRLHLGDRGMAREPQRKQGLRVPVGRDTGGAWRILEAWLSINIE